MSIEQNAMTNTNFGIADLTEKRQRWVDVSEENEFGQGIRNLLTELYPENAHFIFELLQNAEDVGAENVWFCLSEDQLVFEHDGNRHFESKDIESITSIGDSTKKNDPTAIGKFGVGFKAVFAYTESPEIHSGDYHFRIRDLVVPTTDGVDQKSMGGRTRFVFPFNHSTKKKEIAASEIERGLLALSDETLLFLRNIKRLNFSLPAGETGYIERSVISPLVTKIESSKPIAFDENGQQLLDPTRSSHWMRFDRNVELVDSEDDGEVKNCSISVAYQLEKRPQDSREAQGKTRRLGTDSEWQVIPVNNGNVSIYFPAVKEDSRLHFHLHAPFASTVARDSVRECEVNNMLRDALAEIVADSLAQIRDRGMLSVGFLSVLPIPSDNLTEFYAPFQKRIVAEFQNRALTPTRSGKYKRSVRLRRGTNELTSRVGERELATLSKLRFLRWVANPNQRNSREDQFLTSLGIADWTYDDVRMSLPDLDSEKIKNWFEFKTDSWVETLYGSLSKHRDFRAKTVANALPIIRLTDGTHVKASKPRLFLSQQDLTNESIHVVKPTVIQIEEAVEYLKSVGILEFDLVASIKEFILPKYRSGTEIPIDQHLQDLRQILPAYMFMLQDLKSSQIVLCKNAGDGNLKYHHGHQVYFECDDLRTYFDGNSEAWFVDERYSQLDDSKLNEMLRAIGVTGDKPRELNVKQYEFHDHGVHARARDGFNPNWNVFGLEFALDNPTIEKASFIWNKLLPYAGHRIQGLVQRSSRQSFPAGDKTSEQLEVSVAGSMLRGKDWIPDANGVFHSADDIQDVSELHELLSPDGKLLASLDERTSETEKAALGVLGIQNISTELLAQLQNGETAKQSFLGHLGSSQGASDRRKSKIREQSDNAPSRAFGVRERKVRLGRNSSETVLYYLADFYEIEERWHCQMCCYPMQFQKRNGNECCEKRELLSGKWAVKRGLTNLHGDQTEDSETERLPEYDKLNIVLCPICNSIFNEYQHLVDEHQDALLDWFRNENGKVFTIPCSQLNCNEPDRQLHFHQKHVDDIRSIQAVRPDAQNETNAGDAQ